MGTLTLLISHCSSHIMCTLGGRGGGGGSFD